MKHLPEGWLVEPLTTAHNKTEFRCGVESLDRYLQQQASQDARRHAAATFVLHHGTSGLIAGYFTLSATAIDAGEMPPDTAKKLPRYRALPATLLGRLAIDSKFQGKGLGAALLAKALQRSHANTGEIGSVAVVVDAIDEAAAKFYASFGFIYLSSTNRRLFMLMSSIEKLIG